MVTPSLDPAALALLGIIHRHTQGGPPPPDTGSAFATCYADLIFLRFIEKSSHGKGWVITRDGESWLQQHYSGIRPG
jgi:hypothetical protein